MSSEQHEAGDQSPDGITPPTHDPAEASPTSEPSLAGGWANLIDRIRNGAAQLNEERARLHRREEHLQALAAQMEDNLRTANERAAVAEAQTREVEAESRQAISHWQERAIAAEAKLQAMEVWRAKVRAVVLGNPDQPDQTTNRDPPA